MGFPGGSEGKESAGTAGDSGLTPGSGEIPGGNKYHQLFVFPFKVFLLLLLSRFSRVRLCATP